MQMQKQQVHLSHSLKQRTDFFKTEVQRSLFFFFVSNITWCGLKKLEKKKNCLQQIFFTLFCFVLLEQDSSRLMVLPDPKGPLEQFNTAGNCSDSRP